MIKREHIISTLAYTGVGGAAILLAVWISTSLLGPAVTQEGQQPQQQPPSQSSEDWSDPTGLPAEPQAHQGNRENQESEPRQEPEARFENPPPPEPDARFDNSPPPSPEPEQPPMELSQEPPLPGEAYPEISEAPQEPREEPNWDEMKPASLQQGSGNLEKEQLRTEVQSFLEPFIYDPKGRRDPFKSYTEVLIGPGAGGRGGPILPLQRFELDQLKLIGIIWDVHEPKAMIMDPNSRIHTIGRDERVGPNNGYVAAVREGEIVIIESFRQRDGETVYTPRVLRMER